MTTRAAGRPRLLLLCSLALLLALPSASVGGGASVDGAGWWATRRPSSLHVPLVHGRALHGLGAAPQPAGGWPESARRRDLRRLSRRGADVSYELGGDFIHVGSYYVNVSLGSQAQSFHVQVDTGSDLFWVPCNCYACAQTSSFLPVSKPFEESRSASFKEIHCRSDLCRQLALTPPAVFGCDQKPQIVQCEYLYTYGDNSSTQGFLINDVLHFDYGNGTAGQAPVNFGCSFLQTKGLMDGSFGLDGIMGLGRGVIGLQTQLAASSVVDNAFALCLEGEAAGGHLVLGSVIAPRGMHYTSLQAMDSDTFYYVDMTGIRVGDVALELKKSLFAVDPFQGTGAFYDSGTTFTVLPNKAYYLLWQAIKDSSKLQQLNETGSFDCVRGAPISDENLTSMFPTVSVIFASGAEWELSPHNYMFRPPPDTATPDILCFAALNNLHSRASQQTVFGETWMRNFYIYFDRVASRIGWVAMNCKRKLKLGISAAFVDDEPGTTGQVLAEAPPPQATQPTSQPAGPSPPLLLVPSPAPVQAPPPLTLQSPSPVLTPFSPALGQPAPSPSPGAPLVEASFALSGKAVETVLKQESTLLLDLTFQLATPSTKVLIEKVQDKAFGDSVTTYVQLALLPSSTDTSSIPELELRTLKGAFEMLLVDPLRLLLFTELGRPSQFKVLHFPSTVIGTSRQDGQSVPLVTFTLQAVPATIENNKMQLTNQLATALKLKPSESVQYNITASPAGQLKQSHDSNKTTIDSFSAVEACIVSPTGTTFSEQRLLQIANFVTSAVTNGTLSFYSSAYGSPREVSASSTLRALAEGSTYSPPHDQPSPKPPPPPRPLSAPPPPLPARGLACTHYNTCRVVFWLGLLLSSILAYSEQ
eukprot:SM000308S11820  [mRNA]  locus=s308:890:6753:+ [translate_table: standard]